MKNFKDMENAHNVMSKEKQNIFYIYGITACA